MATQLYGGRLADFDSSDNMAKAIEDAYRFIRNTSPPTGAGLDQDLPTGADAQDMRLLFLAIARGVIAYLAAHPHAFQVQVAREVTGDLSDGQVTQINSTS
jgi:hypothetical protein